MCLHVNEFHPLCLIQNRYFKASTNKETKRMIECAQHNLGLFCLAFLNSWKRVVYLGISISRSISRPNQERFRSRPGTHFLLRRWAQYRRKITGFWKFTHLLMPLVLLDIKLRAQICLKVNGRNSRILFWSEFCSCVTNLYDENHVPSIYVISKHLGLRFDWSHLKKTLKMH